MQFVKCDHTIWSIFDKTFSEIPPKRGIFLGRRSKSYAFPHYYIHNISVSHGVDCRRICENIHRKLCTFIQHQNFVNEPTENFVQGKPFKKIHTEIAIS